MKKSDIEKVLSLLSDSKDYAEDERLSKLIGKAGELDADELDTIVAAAQKDRMRFSALLDRIDSEKNND